MLWLEGINNGGLDVSPGGKSKPPDKDQLKGYVRNNYRKLMDALMEVYDAIPQLEEQSKKAGFNDSVNETCRKKIYDVWEEIDGYYHGTFKEKPKSAEVKAAIEDAKKNRDYKVDTSKYK